MGKIFISFIIVIGFFTLSFGAFTTPAYGDFDGTTIEGLSSSSSAIPLVDTWQKFIADQSTVTIASDEAKTASESAENPADQIIWHGPRDRKEVALTFDADMTPVMVDYLKSGEVSTYNDTRITDYLVQNQIKATFFLTGIWIETYPDATKALAANPLFELENHTYSHPSMAGYCYGQPQIPQSQYPFEIERVQQLLQQIAHVTPKYFRFSGGCYDQFGLDLVKKEGLVTVHWDDVADDGFNHNREQIINNVLSEAQNGSIIVMHVGGEPNTPETANALPTIIDGLKAKGFQFVTVDELLQPEKVAVRIDPKEYIVSLKSLQRVPSESL